MRHTIKSNNRVEVDLRVEKGLNSGSDVVRMIVVFTMAVAAIAVVMVPRHDEEW